MPCRWNAVGRGVKLDTQLFTHTNTAEAEQEKEEDDSDEEKEEEGGAWYEEEESEDEGAVSVLGFLCLGMARTCPGADGLR